MTEEEKQSAILIAKRNKYVANRTLEYNKKLKEQSNYPFYTPTELYYQVRDSGIVIDEYNKYQIWALCRYFAGDAKGPLDLRKGIWLYGPVGCYKTSLMRFFNKNQTNSFTIHHVNDVSSQFATQGHDSLERFKNIVKTTNDDLYFGQTEIGICFDDFGTEVDKKHYGNESNVMAEIILCRFNNHQRLIGKTHFTTNINADTVEERYGIRVRSRLREMVNLVEFPDNSPDRRK